jgi:hypothetical protein
MRKFIGDNRHPHTRAANQNTALDLTGRHYLSQRNGKIWVIAGLLTGGSQVQNSV